METQASFEKVEHLLADSPQKAIEMLEAMGMHAFFYIRNELSAFSRGAFSISSNVSLSVFRLFLRLYKLSIIMTSQIRQLRCKKKAVEAL